MSERNNAAAWYRESPIAELAGHIRFDWAAMDSWYEEEEEVYAEDEEEEERDGRSRVLLLFLFWDF